VKLSIVIPARNQSGNIDETALALTRRLVRDRIPHEIIIVVDGSSDNTPDIVLRMAAEQRLRLVRNPAPHGFGRAVAKGLDSVDGDAVVIVMADGSDDPDDVVKYYHVLRDHADCASGSRFMRGGIAQDYPWFK